MITLNRITMLLALAGLSVFLSGCNNQPVPRDPVTIQGVPRESAKVIGKWKMGPFTIGCRIVTDEYVFISDGGGLRGQEGQALRGPGLVPYATVDSFQKILLLAEEASKRNDQVTFYGDLVHERDGSVVEWNGKKVVLLYTATYAGATHEVDRRPWDN